MLSLTKKMTYRTISALRSIRRTLRGRSHAAALTTTRTAGHIAALPADSQLAKLRCRQTNKHQQHKHQHTPTAHTTSIYLPDSVALNTAANSPPRAAVSCAIHTTPRPRASLAAKPRPISWPSCVADAVPPALIICGSSSCSSRAADSRQQGRWGSQAGKRAGSSTVTSMHKSGLLPAGRFDCWGL